MLEIALADDADAQAVARMNAMNALCRDTMGELAALVVDHQIPCDLTHRGTYRAAATARGLASLAAYEAFLKAAQLPTNGSAVQTSRRASARPTTKAASTPRTATWYSPQRSSVAWLRRFPGPFSFLKTVPCWR